ncbi:hypothetical protein [Victivallis vadensis]|uniref:hypothetical protein n=1 Tax=Victivallis vadensis TaxID=172901 RepID=UPI003D081D82
MPYQRLLNITGILLGGIVLSGTEPTIPAGIYGTNIHMIDRVGEDMEDYQAVFASMRASGCLWGRSDNYWITNEPQPGKWYFEETDRFFRDARQAGITILPIFTAADLHLPAHYKPLSAHLSEYRAYLEKFVGRYRDSVKCWQISNEPNSGGSSTRQLECGDYRTYLNLLKLSYETIKATDPEATVVHAGIIGTDNSVTDFGYLERELSEGMANYCDVLSIHPYLESNYPEELYPAGLEKLRQLLKKYGAEHKPLWVTELGDSIGTPPEWEKYYPVAFREAGIDPARTTLLVIEDPEWNFFTEGWMLNAENLGVRFRTKCSIRMMELARQPADTVLLLGTNGDFPIRFYPALQDYLRRGGTIVSAWIMPLYFELTKENGKQVKRQKVEARHMKGLHLGWEAFWTQKGIPGEFSRLRSAFPDMPDFSRYRMAGRILSEKNLHPGDRLIPLIYAEDGGCQRPVAGVYRFNSEFKGNAIINLCWGYPFKARHASDSARTWPRSVLLLRAGGVDKVFTYKYRIHKNRTAQDYGLHNWNLKPLPGAQALKTLFRLFPEKTRIDVVNRDRPWIARGIRPDGKVVHAVWLRHGSAPFRLTFSGKLESVTDYQGLPLDWNDDKLVVTDAPLYLLGPETITVKSAHK